MVDELRAPNNWHSARSPEDLAHGSSGPWASLSGRGDMEGDDRVLCRIEELISAVPEAHYPAHGECRCRELRLVAERAHRLYFIAPAISTTSRRMARAHL